MSDLISRKALCEFCLNTKDSTVNANDIMRFPSAEPEQEIIHCKDCKFYTPMNRKLKIGICDMTMHHLGDDGFCSTAEKRGK